MTPSQQQLINQLGCSLGDLITKGFVQSDREFDTEVRELIHDCQTYLERTNLMLSREEFDEARRRVAAFATRVTED